MFEFRGASSAASTTGNATSRSSPTHWRFLLRDVQRLNVPNLLSVLVDAAVASEEAHSGHGQDALGHPLILVLVGLVNESVCLNVAVEVIGNQVVVTVVSDGGNQGAKVIGHAKGALLNLDKDLLQVRVDGVRTKVVVMAQVFHVLSKVSKQEDVAVADFAGDFNLSYRVNGELLGKVVGPLALTLAPSHVPMMRPPLRTNFMLLVPDALDHLS